MALFFRLCMDSREDLYPMEPLSKVIDELLDIQITPEDEGSRLICYGCVEKISKFYTFKRTCLQNQPSNREEEEREREEIRDFSRREMERFESLNEEGVPVDVLLNSTALETYYWDWENDMECHVEDYQAPWLEPIGDTDETETSNIESSSESSEESTPPQRRSRKRRRSVEDTDLNSPKYRRTSENVSSYNQRINNQAFNRVKIKTEGNTGISLNDDYYPDYQIKLQSRSEEFERQFEFKTVVKQEPEEFSDGYES